MATPRPRSALGVTPRRTAHPDRAKAGEGATALPAAATTVVTRTPTAPEFAELAPAAPAAQPIRRRSALPSWLAG
jgi:hypothetical protein